MDVAISNVGCSIFASIIYDISKVCLGKFFYKNDEHSIKKIKEMIQKELGTKYEILYGSGEFNAFFMNPFFKDIIENFIIYKITGNCEGDLHKIKKNNNTIMEKDVIDFLIDYLFQQYYGSHETLSMLGTN